MSTYKQYVSIHLLTMDIQAYNVHDIWQQKVIQQRWEGTNNTRYICNRALRNGNFKYIDELLHRVCAGFLAMFTFTGMVYYLLLYFTQVLLTFYFQLGTTNFQMCVTKFLGLKSHFGVFWNLSALISFRYSQLTLLFVKK